MGLFIIYAFVQTTYISRILKKNYLIKVNEGYKFDKNDITYENFNKLITVVVLCHISGILSGIVGLSGGIVLGPLFLQLGMLPIVVASTN